MNTDTCACYAKGVLGTMTTQKPWLWRRKIRRADPNFGNIKLGKGQQKRERERECVSRYRLLRPYGGPLSSGCYKYKAY